MEKKETNWEKNEQKDLNRYFTKENIYIAIKLV